MDKLVSASELFADRVFRIPDYQRGYSWEQTQWEDLWNDLMSLRSDQFHYTGALATQRVSEKHLLRWAKESSAFERQHWFEAESAYPRLRCQGTAITPLHIVDGQQRMLTIAILLTVISENLVVTSDAWRQMRDRFLERTGPQGNYFVLGYEVDLPSHYYLVKTVYQDVASGEVETAYTRNLRNAKHFFNSEIREMPPEQVQSLLHKVATQLRFNYYEHEASVDVSVIFETMNNRGRPLSKLELLKNRLLYLTTQFPDLSDAERESAREHINDGWRHIYEWLAKNSDEPLSDDEFLRNHWIMYFDHRAQNQQIIRTLDFARDLLANRFRPDHARQGKVGLVAVRKYVDSLRSSIMPWFTINYPSHQEAGGAPELRRWVQRINDIRRSSFFRPIILALLQRHDLSESAQIALLKAMERHEFLVTGLVRSRSTANRPYFWRAAYEFFTHDRDVNDLIHSIKHRAEKFYSQKKFYKAMEKHHAEARGSDGGWAAWRHLRYFLQEYEISLGGDVATLETTKHAVFPGPERSVALVSEWRSLFADLTPPKQAQLASTLGNLVLRNDRPMTLLSNSVARQRTNGRGSFEYRKSHDVGNGELDGYAHGSMGERELAEYAQWGPAEILSRGVKMLKFMAQRWNIALNDKFCRTLTKVNWSTEDEDRSEVEEKFAATGR